MSNEENEEEDTRHRVKVYEMIENGNWIDKGTGNVTCSYNEVPVSFNQHSQAYTIVVRSDIDGSPVLSSKVQSSPYTRQQGISV